MKKAIILIIILSIVSCKNTNNNAINNEVITFMIDKKLAQHTAPAGARIHSRSK